MSVNDHMLHRTAGHTTLLVLVVGDFSFAVWSFESEFIRASANTRMFRVYYTNRMNNHLIIYFNGI